MIKVHRYFVFAAADYEAQGGLNDLIGMTDYPEEAKKIIEKHRLGKCYLDFYWTVDMSTLKMVNMDTDYPNCHYECL